MAGAQLRTWSLLCLNQAQDLALQQLNLLCLGASWGPSLGSLCRLMNIHTTGQHWHVSGGGFPFLHSLPLLLSLYIVLGEGGIKKVVLKMPLTSHFTLLLFALELCAATPSVNDPHLSSWFIAEPCRFVGKIPQPRVRI